MSQNEESELQAAYELISDYKEGNLQEGTPLNSTQIILLKRLRSDLLPKASHLDDDLSALISQVANEDTRVNHQVMKTISEIYDLQSKNREFEAEALRSAFLEGCSSLWYANIVQNA